MIAIGQTAVGSMDSSKADKNGDRNNDDNGKKVGDGQKTKSKARSRQRNKKNKARDPPAASEAITHDEVDKEEPPKEKSNKNKKKSSLYTEHRSLEECVEAYGHRTLVRGMIRVLPYSPSSADKSSSFVSCDRGSYRQDIFIEGVADRNRAIDGDTVYVEVIENAIGSDENSNENTLESQDDDEKESEVSPIMWQDDATQMNLWNPIVPVEVRTPSRKVKVETMGEENQSKGRVVCIEPPQRLISGMAMPNRRLVGTIRQLNLRDGGKTILLTPNNRSLPQFRCPTESTLELMKKVAAESKQRAEDCYYTAHFVPGSWKANHRWPPCKGVKLLGAAFDVENEIQALLAEHDVDHGDHQADVLKSVDEAVHSGLCYENGDMEWKPTPEMYKGRRDYRSKRIFTIDPTTAKDLDDALHIEELQDGTLEVGVHIADVSFFVTPDTPVDEEAKYRTTTVYLVDRTVPMLPRALCEIACSLNENVERLAFSCVWHMNKDGTMVKDKEVWYGRTVIKSCARLDYATAQNIIEHKVAKHGCGGSDMDADLWPPSRRPVGHSIEDVAADVRLMHKVAMSRRRQRMDNGALVMNGVKLTFKLDEDGQTPLLTEPYPIKDSNRVVEEYMLLANFLVAQRLITHAKDLALVRNHVGPDLDNVFELQDFFKAAYNFDIDVSSSQGIHSSLIHFGISSNDVNESKSITQMLMGCMKPAEYIPAGGDNPQPWHHFALHIPYYTHFTSPIRRYPDVLVHRLLQATIDDNIAETISFDTHKLGKMCVHCNEKRLGSKRAQERCDRVFLSLYVKKNPLKSLMGIVLTLGKSVFTVFIPDFGVAAKLFLEEHKDMLTFAFEQKNKEQKPVKRLLLQRKPEFDASWSILEIKPLVRLKITMTCKEEPPVDVKLRLEGPWTQ